MSIRMNEAELNNLGLAIEGEKVVTINEPPDDTWKVDRLRAYAVGELDQSKDCKEQALLLAKKSVVHLYRAGYAFFLIREKLKKINNWMAWIEESGLAFSTVAQAIQLYERFESEEVLGDMTITQAKEEAGIVKNTKKAKNKKGKSRSIQAPSKGEQATKSTEIKVFDPEPTPEDEFLTDLHQIVLLLEEWIGKTGELPSDNTDDYQEAIDNLENKVEELKNALAA